MPATINRELEGLQRAFTLAVEAGTIALESIRKVMHTVY
jgi:hypothetical protein